MADEDWKQGFCEPPVVRPAVLDQLKIEQPLQHEIQPLPLPALVVQDPNLAAEFWQGAAKDDTAASQPDQPPSEAEMVSQMAMALYLLQAVHSGTSKAQEHLPRAENEADDDDDDGRE